MNKNKNNITKSSIIPDKYKNQYNNDFKELKEELKKSEENLNKGLKSLSEEETIRLDVFLAKHLRLLR